MKAQVATEYIIILTVILGALIPLVFLSFGYLNEHKAVADANSAFNTMKSSIDQCFSLSPGSKITTIIYLPQSYQKTGSSISSNALTLKFALPNGEELVISGSVKGQIQGKLPDYNGNFVFTFEMLDTNKVNIDYLGSS